MAVRITCPACDASYSVDDSKRGKKVSCRECEKPIAVPAESTTKRSREEEGVQARPKIKATPRKRDEEDSEDRAPVRKKKPEAKAGFPVLLVVGGIAAVFLVLVVGAAGLGLVFWLKAKPADAPPDLAAKRDGKKIQIPNDPGPDPDPIQKPKPDPDPGKGLPNDVAPEVVGRVKQATVYLRVTLPSGQVSEGSGFFALERGIVVTNAHVLGMLSASSRPPETVEVVVNSGEANELKTVGQVLGVDRASDLGVLRVNLAAMPAPLELEMNAKLFETQKVFIFGFPFGAELGKNITVSPSNVSSLRNDGTGALERIQVNGGMHPGNSGGPVVNAAGKLVGVSVAGIKGTQINFAIPAEKVRLVMEGRLADSKLGEAYTQGAEARMPVRYTCLDPLNRIREMKVEVWAGQPGTTRPYSLQKPATMPGDGPRQTHKVNYQNGVGLLDVPLPALGPGQVYWFQPVITGQNVSHWGTALATPTSLILLERKAANLQVSLETHKKRTITVKNASTFTIYKGKQKGVFGEKLQATMLEDLYPHARGARMVTGVGNLNLSAEEDGRPLRVDPEVTARLRVIPPVFVVDGTNKLRERADTNLNPALPFDLREDIKDKYSQMCNALEAVNMPMPNRLVQPNERWPTQIPMLVRTAKKAEVVDLDLVCKFEGVRQRKQRQEAVITVTGRVKGRDANAKKVGGDVFGKIAFDLAAGFISEAKLTIQSELDLLGGAVQAVVAFDIDLERQAGNPMNIQLPPNADPYGKGSQPIAKGKLIFGQANFLRPTDPPVNDQQLRQRGSRMKIYPVLLQGGKTYVIDLTSNAFDSYLFLVSPTGQLLARDDDGGGFPHARIVHRATATGLHRVIVSSFDGKFGPFQLSVHEVGTGPAKKIGANQGPGPGPAPLPQAKGFTRPGKAAQPTSYMSIDSPKGDYIGQGRNYQYRGDELKVQKTPRGVNVSVDGWNLAIGAPNGQFLQIGEYQDAKRFAFSGASPGLDFFGKGRGSNRVAGEFVVWELEFNGDQVTRLAIDFVQRSEERGPPLRGRVRVNSTLE
ncbi:MAG: trypsin-like peptidase domain-containing protein [Planctomycetes bacterium]|nr:trypsin-like peptidase domain-containing protein [Planctomycetota bacterium]